MFALYTTLFAEGKRRRLDLASHLFGVISAIAVMGLGVGISLALYGTIVQSAFPQPRVAQATSTLNFLQELGGPVALAVKGSIQASLYLPAFSAALPLAIKQRIPISDQPWNSADRSRGGRLFARDRAAINTAENV